MTREQWIAGAKRFLPGLEDQEYELMADLHLK